MFSIFITQALFINRLILNLHGHIRKKGGILNALNILVQKLKKCYQILKVSKSEKFQFL